MTTEEDIHKIFITPESMHAAHACTLELTNFISYIKSIDPQLKKAEALLVAAAILNQFPDIFASNPEMLAELKITCQIVKDRQK